MKQESLRIVLVEDDAPTQARIHEVLEPPHRVERAASLVEAQERIDRGDVDAILLDLGLPDSRGLETLARVRARAPGVPVVVLTEEADDESTALKALHAGAQDFLPKSRPESDLWHRALRYAVERSRAQQALAVSDARFRQIFEASPAGIFIRDSEDRVVEWSPAMETITGVRRDEAVGRRHRRVFEELVTTAGDAPGSHAGMPVEEILGRLSPSVEAAAAQPQRASWTVRRPDGEERVVESTHFALHHTDGWASGGVIGDVTVRERSCAAQRREQQRAQQTLDLVPVLVVSLDTEGVVTLINKAGETLLGGDADSIVGKEWFETFVPEPVRAGLQSGFATLLAGTNLDWRRHKSPIVGADGQERLMAWSSVVVRDDDGRPQGVLSAAADLTGQAALERRLADADRLASVGRLSAAVAHEVNNPLSYILSNLEYLADHLPEIVGAAQRGLARTPPELRTGGDHASLNLGLLDDVVTCVRDCVGGAKRIRRVVGDLRTLAREDDDVREPVDINEAIDAAISLARNEVRFRARLVRDFGVVPPVLANERQLVRLVVNLLVNASQAITEGDVERNAIVVRSYCDDQTVSFDVSDTGCGISDADMPDLFDPFVPTTALGTSTGLGLCICHTIVSALGGRIEVQSRIDEGSTFKVHLPAYSTAEDCAPPAVAPSAAGRPRVHPPRVLVVDDEPLVTRAMRRALGEAFEVVTATSAREARAILTRCNDFVAILCDVIMPDESGVDLHEWIAAHHPRLAPRVVFVSGGALTERSETYLASVGCPCLKKPFDNRQLRAIVKERCAV